MNGIEISSLVPVVHYFWACFCHLCIAQPTEFIDYCDVVNFLGAELNDQLLGSQLLACTLSHNTLFGEAVSDLMVKPDGPYDFYQHPNVPEARHCQPVLQGFSEAVSQLLQDWPEHPALEQVGQPVRREPWGHGLCHLQRHSCAHFSVLTKVLRTPLQWDTTHCRMDIPVCTAVV